MEKEVCVAPEAVLRLLLLLKMMMMTMIMPAIEKRCGQKRSRAPILSQLHASTLKHARRKLTLIFTEAKHPAIHELCHDHRFTEVLSR